MSNISTSPISLAQKAGMLIMAPLYENCLDDLVGKFACGSLLSWGGEFGDTSPNDIPEFCDLMNRTQELSQRHRGLPTWIHGWPHQAIAGRKQGWLTRAAADNVEPSRIEWAAQLLGRRWRALGVHNIPEPTLNVPMYDTGILPKSPTSPDAEKVRRYGTAFNRGILAGNCGTMAQHFPAHGATPLDSHDDHPVVDMTIDELWSSGIPSFRWLHDGLHGASHPDGSRFRQYCNDITHCADRLSERADGFPGHRHRRCRRNEGIPEGWVYRRDGCRGGQGWLRFHLHRLYRQRGNHF